MIDNHSITQSIFFAYLRFCYLADRGDFLRIFKQESRS